MMTHHCGLMADWIQIQRHRDEPQVIESGWVADWVEAGPFTATSDRWNPSDRGGLGADCTRVEWLAFKTADRLRISCGSAAVRRRLNQAESDCTQRRLATTSFA